MCLASAASVSGQAAQDSIAADSTELGPFPRQFTLDPMLVTATRTARSASDLAVAVNIVGRNELETRPIRLLTDLLSEQPGILIQQTTAGQGSPFIRGLTGSQILLLVDGVRLNNGTFRQGPSQYLATIDPEIVDRLEVVRGASSTLYGSDAIGGVVQVLTRPPSTLLDPGDRFGGEASLTYDGATDGGRIRLTGVSDFPEIRDGLTVMAGGSIGGQGDLRPGGGLPAQDPTGFSQWGTDVRADLTWSDRWTWDGAAQYFEQEDVPRFDRLVDFRDPSVAGGGIGRNAVYTFQPQTRTLLRSRLTGTFDQPWFSAVDFSLSWQRQKEGRTTQVQSVDSAGAVVPSSTRSFVSDAVGSVSVDLQVRAQPGAGDSEITYGVEAWRHRTSSFGYQEEVDTGMRTAQFRESDGEQIATGRFPDGSRFSGAALYAFLDRSLGDDLRAQAGVRGSLYWTRTRVGDDFGGTVDSRFSNVSLEGGLVWSAAPDLDVRARAAQAFRAPNIYDLTLVGDVPGGFSLPNPDLEPETSITWEAGARWTGEHAYWDATLFRLEVDGLLDRVKGTFQGDTLFGPDQMRVFTIQNVGRATIHGVELGFGTALPADGSLEGGVHWFRGTADVIRDDAPLTEPLSRVPPASLDLRLEWPFRAVGRTGWVAYHGRAAAAQRRLGFRDELDSRIQDGGTPGYTLHSVRAGSTLTETTTLTIGVENLFDQLYRVHGSGIDAPGRHLFLRVDLRGSAG